MCVQIQYNATIFIAVSSAMLMITHSAHSGVAYSWLCQHSLHVDRTPCQRCALWHVEKVFLSLCRWYSHFPQDQAGLLPACTDCTPRTAGEPTLSKGIKMCSLLSEFQQYLAVPVCLSGVGGSFSVSPSLSEAVALATPGTPVFNQLISHSLGSLVRPPLLARLFHSASGNGGCPLVS